MEIESPGEKNGQAGVLIHTRVKIIPLGPAGPYEIDGYLIQHNKDAPEPVGRF